MNAARAMKYTGGTVSVTTRLNGNFVRISIEDEGSGIPEDILKDIFSLEVRMRPDWPGEGTGTGLLICKEILFRHRGNIEIKSTGGRYLRRYGVPVEFTKEKRHKGTEVDIDLPYRREDINDNVKGISGVDQLQRLPHSNS
jgi:signal transduction histidine kinase